MTHAANMTHETIATVNFAEAFRQITTYGTLTSLPVLRETSVDSYEVVEGHTQVEVWGEFNKANPAKFEMIPAVVIDRKGKVHNFLLVDYKSIAEVSKSIAVVEVAAEVKPTQQEPATTAQPAPQPQKTEVAPALNAKQLRKAAATLGVDVSKVNFRSSKQRTELQKRLEQVSKGKVVTTAKPQEKKALDVQAVVARMQANGLTRGYAQKLVDKYDKLVAQHQYDAAERLLAAHVG